MAASVTARGVFKHNLSLALLQPCVAHCVSRFEDFAKRISQSESLQQTLFPYHEAWG